MVSDLWIWVLKIIFVPFPEKWKQLKLKTLFIIVGFLRNFTGQSSTPLAGTSIGSNTSAASKTEKSRSSSRSRTPKNPQENPGPSRNPQELPRHAPVKRVSVSKMTSNLSSSLCGSMKNLSELDLTGGESVKNKGDQRLAYLLLGKF